MKVWRLVFTMPNPEIARRCRACGASVRAGVQFCPQCGQAMVKSVVFVHPTPDPPETSVRAKVNADEARRTDLAAERKSEPPSTAGPVRAPDFTPPARAAARDQRAASGTNARAKDPAGGRQMVKRRPRHAAAEDNSLLPRVEKLRQASVDVLDEAADDPSLRFVIISVTLFLCFLLIFLASTIFY